MGEPRGTEQKKETLTPPYKEKGKGNLLADSPKSAGVIENQKKRGGSYGKEPRGTALGGGKRRKKGQRNLSDGESTIST